MDWARSGVICARLPGGVVGSLAGADLGGLPLDCLARPAARAVRLHLVVAAPGGDD